MIWFQDIKNQNELKSKFRELAQIHHPDHGGDAAAMREIIAAYQSLARILPEAAPVEMEKAAERPENFHCPYRPATAGGSNARLARLASPFFTHREICLMAKTLFVYAGVFVDCDIRIFYWKLCRIIDPGQSRPYCDYFFSREIARKSLRSIRETLKRVWNKKLWQMVKTAQSALA